MVYLVWSSTFSRSVKIFSQAASKYIAEDNSKASAIKNKTVKSQLIFSLFVFSVYLLFADLLGDPSLSIYIRISAFIIPAGAFFTLYTNFLNGLRWYGKQAQVMFFYSIAKVIGVFVLVFFGFAVYGAIFGYLMGSLVGLALGWYFFKFKGNKGERDDIKDFEHKKIIDFAVPVIIFSVTFTFLISADLFFVKRTLMENVHAGYYTAASMLSRVPFHILSALGFALFPAISRSTAINDVEQTENYIASSMRYLLMFLIYPSFSSSSKVIPITY
jgi:Membrane protein involved in the export of O-antigen and teichoic acid